MKVLGFTRRVVIDTNVLVSALLTPNGPSADFIGDVLDEKYEVIVTQSILEEYADVLNRPRFQLRPEMISFFLNWIINHALFIEVDESDYPKEEMSDPKDAPFYVAARCAGALLVTHNIRHYPVTEWRTMIWELV